MGDDGRVLMVGCLWWGVLGGWDGGEVVCWENANGGVLMFGC